MPGDKPQKAVCPFCKTPKIHKRRHSPGYFCYSCKVAFRDPLINEPHNTGAV